jgi:hypothetical protein
MAAKHGNVLKIGVKCASLTLITFIMTHAQGGCSENFLAATLHVLLKIKAKYYYN